MRLCCGLQPTVCSLEAHLADLAPPSCPFVPPASLLESLSESTLSPGSTRSWKEWYALEWLALQVERGVPREQAVVLRDALGHFLCNSSHP